jgi:hypothetical protein
MFIDDLSDATWLTHVQSDGSQIGGIDPLRYGVQAIPSKHLSLLLWTSGTTDPKVEQYPAFMAYPAVPRLVPQNTGNVSLDFHFMLGGSLADFNGLETDLLPVIDGWKYPGSLIYLQQGGFEINNATGNWISSGVDLGALSVNQKYRTTVTYQLDTVNHLLSVVSIALNNVPFPEKPVLQKVAATDTSQGGKVAPWKDGAYVQLQTSSDPLGEPWCVNIWKPKLRWW